MPEEPFVNTVRGMLTDPVEFIKRSSKLSLRSYQVEVARAVVESVIFKRGLSFVVLFPRQSGKNELQAQIETYLLAYLQEFDAEIIKVSPTWRPQSINAMRRLERVLQKNALTHGEWKKESGYIYRCGSARIFFLSGAPEANIVGATASALLEVDEAQDLEIEKYDKDIAPMAASTNATRIFWGTAWTSQTLLARELRAAREAERQDRQRRVFVVDAERVAAEVPAYGKFVAAQVVRLGRSHPLVRTQFYSEEIDGEGGMFPAERRLRMQGSHPASDQPHPGQTHALLLDVAGEDEAAEQGGDPAGWALKNPGRDATALTVVEVDLTTLEDAQLRAPTYRCVHRRQWLGVRHTDLYAELVSLADAWQASWLVVDATGVGAGLAAFLRRSLPGRVAPFQFNAASKSKLGWDFLSVVDSGRWKEPAGNPGVLDSLFQRQLQHCQYEITTGPDKRMRWGVPDGARDPANGEPVHDDLLLSAALSAVLDTQPWGSTSPALVVTGRDPLKDLDSGF
ncbi:MAG: hypothetical protein ACYC6K_03955 [Bellilinea sp.]